jgi:hypothetical protein
MEQAREHREERRGGTKAQNFIRDKGDPRLYPRGYIYNPNPNIKIKTR